jgi:hypothetical protein
LGYDQYYFAPIGISSYWWRTPDDYLEWLNWREAMCLTRTVDFIDFSQLTEDQKKDLENLRDKLQKRKAALEEEMALLDEGLEKLNDKLG